MKTLQEQYNLLNEGKGRKDEFMKSARRLFPHLVTNITPYNRYYFKEQTNSFRRN